VTFPTKFRTVQAFPLRLISTGEVCCAVQLVWQLETKAKITNDHITNHVDYHVRKIAPVINILSRPRKLEYDGAAKEHVSRRCKGSVKSQSNEWTLHRWNKTT